MFNQCVFQVLFDRLKGMALILYNNTDFAQAAVRETKGWKIGGNKIKVRIKMFYIYPSLSQYLYGDIDGYIWKSCIFHQIFCLILF